MKLKDAKLNDLIQVEAEKGTYILKVVAITPLGIEVFSERLSTIDQKEFFEFNQDAKTAQFIETNWKIVGNSQETKEYKDLSWIDKIVYALDAVANWLDKRFKNKNS